MVLDVIKNLCKSRGITINRLEQELGFSQGSIGKMNDSVPKADRLYKIAEYFDLPMEYFLTPDEKLDYYYARIQNHLQEYLKEKPLYRTAAGQGTYNGTYADEFVELVDNNYEYAEVVGDSMLPELRNGDIVQIQPQTETSPHDFTLVKIDGENATIKFVEIADNGVWLRALNKEVFEDRFYSIQEVMTLPITIVGKVVGMQRKFR